MLATIRRDGPGEASHVLRIKVGENRGGVYLIVFECHMALRDGPGPRAFAIVQTGCAACPRTGREPAHPCPTAPVQPCRPDLGRGLPNEYLQARAFKYEHSRNLRVSGATSPVSAARTRILRVAKSSSTVTTRRPCGPSTAMDAEAPAKSCLFSPPPHRRASARPPSPNCWD